MNSNDFMEPLILNDKYMSIAPLWNICVIWCRKKHRLHRIVYLLSHIWTYISWFECGSKSRKSCQLKSQKLIMIFKFWLVKKASRSSSSEIQNQCRKISLKTWLYFLVRWPVCRRMLYDREQIWRRIVFVRLIVSRSQTSRKFRDSCCSSWLWKCSRAIILRKIIPTKPKLSVIKSFFRSLSTILLDLLSWDSWNVHPKMLNALWWLSSIEPNLKSSFEALKMSAGIKIWRNLFRMTDKESSR